MSWKILSADYVASAADALRYPPPVFPEIAFAGRSNVGKSSLINAILNRKKLAFTSRTPGKTQTLNFFLINGRVYFTDLPGYGYASVPMAIRGMWDKMMAEYFEKRANIRAVVILIDVRRDLGDEERALSELLAQAGIKRLIAVTKADKFSRSQSLNRRAKLAAELGLPKEDIYLCSALKHTGIEELRNAIRAEAKI